MIYRFYSLLFLNIICNITILSASSYNHDVLNIFSKVLPRIVLMSSKKNDINKAISICILYDEIDRRAAESFIDQTKKNYPRGIKNYQINFIKASYVDMNKCKNTTIGFLLNSDKQNTEKALEYFFIHNILTSAYDSSLLQYGTDISMFLGKKILPYINVKSIQNKNIELDNTLLRISKIYNQELR